MKIRFSLRTILIVSTLLIIALALFIEPRIRNQRIQNAVDELSPLGRVGYDEDDKVISIQCEPEFAGDRFPLEQTAYLPHLETILLRNGSVVSMEPLAKLKELKTVWLDRTGVKSWGDNTGYQFQELFLDQYEDLKSVPKLENVTLLRVGFAGRAYIFAHRDPQFLEITGQASFDFELLKQFPSLKKLELLRQNLKNFEQLNASIEELFVFDCFVQSFQGLEDAKGLKSISLQECLFDPNFDNRDLEQFGCRYLADCQPLEQIIISSSTPREIEKLIREAMPSSCKLIVKD